MFGAIIGDIVGSRFEFTSAPKAGFELFTDECNFTDDTICTIAIADALIHKKDFKQTLHEWCRRYPDPMGSYGNRFYNWVRSDDPQPMGSYGNGAAMRVTPAVLRPERWKRPLLWQRRSPKSPTTTVKE